MTPPAPVPPPWHGWIVDGFSTHRNAGTGVGPAGLAAWATGAGADPTVAWRGCPRGEWLLWALGRAAVNRRALVLAAAGCVRRVVPLLPRGEVRPQRVLDRAEAWAYRIPYPDDDGEGPATDMDGITHQVLAAAYAAYGTATIDPFAAARAAAQTAHHVEAAATYGAQDDLDLVHHVLQLRWPLSKARTRRWPATALVAWDLLADRTTGIADLSTVDVLCARSLLPSLDDDPSLRLGILRERLWLAPDLTDQVTSLLAKSE